VEIGVPEDWFAIGCERLVGGCERLRVGVTVRRHGSRCGREGSRVLQSTKSEALCEGAPA
jgi:hypothetical protein